MSRTRTRRAGAPVRDGPSPDRPRRPKSDRKSMDTTNLQGRWLGPQVPARQGALLQRGRPLIWSPSLLVEHGRWWVGRRRRRRSLLSTRQLHRAVIPRRGCNCRCSPFLPARLVGRRLGGDLSRTRTRRAGAPVPGPSAGSATTRWQVVGQQHRLLPGGQGSCASPLLLEARLDIKLLATGETTAPAATTRPTPPIPRSAPTVTAASFRSPSIWFTSVLLPWASCPRRPCPAAGR